MRPQSHRPAPAGSIAAALRSKTSLRNVCATAVAAAIGFAPAIVISSPAMAAAGDYTIADARATEGNSVVFTISRAAPTSGPLLAETINWATADNSSAVAGLDYTAASGSLTFPAYSGTAAQTRTITVTTLQDNVDEPDEETFTVNFTGTVAGTLPPSADGTIVDDDNPTYTLTASPTTVNESASPANRHATVTARLSAASPYTVQIPVVSEDGTATAGQDYTALSDVIVIAPGSLTGTAQVDVLDDDIDEPDVQTFVVKGTNQATNVSGTQQVSIGIVDNDATPKITIGSPGTVAEGSAVTFPVTLDHPSESTITAQWSTADGPAGTPTVGHGTATAGQDYTAVTNGTLTFDPLSTSPNQDLTVQTKADDLDEVSPEDLSVQLSAPTNAVLDTPSAVTAGINDDASTAPPEVTLTPGTSVTEGGPSTARARTFTVKLSKASGQVQKVDYSVAAGTADAGNNIGVATAGQDFTATAGTLTFQPGETSKTFTVNVIGDTTDEGAGENMAVTLSDGGAAANLTGTALQSPTQITITDDDAAPVISLTKPSMSVDEGDGFTPVLFTVQLSNPSSENLAVDITDTTNPLTGAQAGGTNPGDDDYDLLSSSPVTIPAGQTTGYALIVVNGDQVYEPNENVTFTAASASSNGNLASGGPLTQTVTIANDDNGPVLKINDVTGTEGSTVAVTATVTGASQTDTHFNMTVQGKSVNGSNAADPADFDNPGPFLLTLPAQTASGTADIPVRTLTLTQDTRNEPNETIVVSGSAIAGTVGTVTGPTVVPGVVTIQDDDQNTTNVTLAAPPYRLGVGTITLHGRTTPGATVQLLAAPVDSDAGLVNNGATVVADSDGDFAFNRKLTNRGVRFAAKVNDVTSDEVTVMLREDPVVTGGSNSKGTATLKVAGDPLLPGGKFVIQRANANGSWSTVFTGNLMSTGTYTKTLTGQPSGKYVTYRAYVYGSTALGIQGGYSPTKRVGIR